MPSRKIPPVGVPQVLRMQDFSGGWVTARPPELLVPGEARQADDVLFDKRGSLSPRRGRTQRYDAAFSNRPVLGLASIHREDGIRRLVMASGTVLYQDTPFDLTIYTTQGDFQAPDSRTWNQMKLAFADWRAVKDG